MIVARSLGAGECEAIALAEELGADDLLLDDRVARRLATARGLSVTGTLGVLLQAADRGLLDLPEVIVRLRATSFRMPEAVVHEMLRNDAKM